MISPLLMLAVSYGQVLCDAWVDFVYPRLDSLAGTYTFCFLC